MADQSSDFDKLYKAYKQITTNFGSLDNLLEAFGLAHMPTAQRYGILFGCLTFVCTLTAVACLLLFGGSFTRIVEQAQSGDATIPHAHMARAERALLLERLLDARERMMQYYPKKQIANGLTNLTKMLQIVHVEHDTGDEKKGAEKRYPDGYKENYEAGYRKCQDSPGGIINLKSLHFSLLFFDCLGYLICFLIFKYKQGPLFPVDQKLALRPMPVLLLVVAITQIFLTAVRMLVCMRLCLVKITKRMTNIVNFTKSDLRILLER